MIVLSRSKKAASTDAHCVVLAAYPHVEHEVTRATLQKRLGMHLLSMPRVALLASDPATRLALVRAFEDAPPDWDVALWREDRPFDIRVADVPLQPGDIPFDRKQPRRTVSEVARSLAAGSARVIVVTGARRGVGVTTLALHLAAARADRRAVALLDLDPASSLRARLGLPDDARHWGPAAPSPGGGPEVAGAELPYSAGFRILLAPPDGAEDDASRVVTAASSRTGDVIVDAPLGRWLDPALDRATTGVLVVPPSRQGMAHACALLERRPDIRWSCVVNRLGPGGEVSARHVAQALDRPAPLELPCSPYLRDREDDHRLLTERWSRYYRRVMRLAAAI